MTLSARQVQSLQAMGLTVWIPRPDPVIESSSLQSIDAASAVRASSIHLPHLVLVIESKQGQTLSPLLSDLLGKILNAMSLDATQCHVDLVDQAPDIVSRDDLSSRRDVVIFGDCPASKSINGLIVLPALSRILSDRVCKAQAWSQIKHWLTQRSG